MKYNTVPAVTHGTKPHWSSIWRRVWPTRIIGCLLSGFTLVFGSSQERHPLYPGVKEIGNAERRHVLRPMSDARISC
jgi:hypothetical protein